LISLGVKDRDALAALRLGEPESGERVVVDEPVVESVVEHRTQRRNGSRPPVGPFACLIAADRSERTTGVLLAEGVYALAVVLAGALATAGGVVVGPAAREALTRLFGSTRRD
jgi:hypothetical protein